MHTPQWGSTLDCSGCHGFPPTYVTGSPKANSHPAHNSLTCSNCHFPTTSNGTSITTPAKHLNKNLEILEGNGATFSYVYATDGGSCSDISCHPTSYKTGKWGEAACLKCHFIALGNRAAISAQFGANSHHIQGTLTDAKCYQCHWEATSNGTINPTYHSGSAAPGAPVNLVVYGNQARPTTYTSGTTAVEYTADNTRTQIQKINNHCLGCHNEQNITTIPFGDGNTPSKYAWDGKSVDARYSQAGTTAWGKYSTAKGANKKVTKALSAHGNSAANQRGWNSSTGVDRAIANTSGTVGIQCYDCHNSHGSTTAGITSRYSSVTGRNRGGILKDTDAGKGGYSVAYKPYTSGSTANKNRLNPGANLCLDCHLSQTASTTPWGYNSTFGAAQPILSYWDALSYKGYSTSGAKNRYSFKGLNPKMGGHFGASSPLSVQPSPANQINGLCTPCHDPHGVSPTLAGDQQYSVPLLKGTWLTSPYKEDTAPATNARMTSRTDLGKEGVPYNIDQNTFGSGLITAVTGITQTESQAEGLCLGCHAKASLTNGVTHTWKSKDRIHESVKGWKTANATVKHNYSCSKCHGPHTNSTLPRLMVTNCLDSQHKGRTTWANAITSASGYGEFLLNSNVTLHKCTEIPASYGWCDISNWPNGGRGGGRIPGGWKGTNYRFGDYTVACHEGQTASAADQSWNEVTPWGFYPPMTNTVPAATTNGLQATITWSTNIPGSTTVNYGLTSAYGSSTTDPASVFNHTVTLTNLTNHKTYHYQVNSINPDGKQITSIDYTVPYISLPPTIPVLVAQSNGVCDSSCSQTLQWNASTDPDSGPIEYQVQVDTSASFNTGNLQTSTWAAGTSWSPVLATNSTWYWRVQTRDANHTTAQDPTSGWSTTSSFILLTGVPATPTMGAPSALSGSIRWNFTDYANNEVGFKMLDPSNDSLKASAATLNLTYFDETGLTANTRYTRHVHAYNAIGDSRPTADTSIYTLSATPNVTANKTTSTWYNTAGVTFTNAAGFGSGGVQYYRYVWNQNPTHVFSDNEQPWTGSTLMMTANATGRWYLHVKAFNGDNIANGTQDYGPYYYDITPPSGLGNSAPTDGALNLPVNSKVYSTVAADNDSAQVQYWFQVATDSGFTTGLQQSSTWQTAYSFAPTLVADTTYYWHVKARDGMGNVTAYTPSWSFRTTPNAFTWTTKGDFENNTTRSQVEVSGAIPADDASVILLLKRLSKIASGRFHSLALRDDGSVWAWGRNWYGQTGNNATPSTPVQIPALGPGSGVVEIAGGECNSLFAKTDGSVWGMGEMFGSTPRAVTNLGAGSGVIKVAAGSEHFMALKSNGSVWAWGVRNWYGQVGNGSTSSVSNPIEILPAGSGIIAVAAGETHSLALKSDGSVFAWGENGSGRLGDGTTTNRYSPVAVSVLGSGSGVIAVSAGDSHSLALKSDGSVWGWGAGFGSTPVEVPTLGATSGVIAITAGYSHSLSLKSDGSVWGFGGSYGATPVQILSPGSGINAVAAGESFSMALQANHYELAWGTNGDGQLGTGNTSNVAVPVQNLMYGVYNSTGTISNLKLDAGSSKYWGAISWNVTTPLNTAIKFRTRGAGTAAGLTSATWSPYYTSSGSPINTAASQWLEVELTEQTSDGIFTPTLDDITVTYVTNPILPFVTTFTATSPSTSWNIPITSFIANGSNAVTGYLITTSVTPPLAGDAGWSGSAPAIYTVAANGTYTLYPWAKDAAGNVSAAFVSPASVSVDAATPTVTAFTAASPSAGNITITSFAATDNTGVTGYLVTTSATPPSAGAAGWSGSAPATYTVMADGTYTLYPWVKDGAGNVSAVFGSPASVSVVGIDITAPLVWSFTAAPAAGTFVVPIYSFTASDNAGVTGYLITTSATTPAAGAAGWTGTPPATYTIPGGGTYALYPWAKDAAGNVSPAYGSPVSVSYDATRPSVAAFTATLPSSSRNITIASFTATDSVGVGGYLITTSSTQPLSTDTGWSGSAPTTYTVAADGRYTLYPWAKDTAGNVSSVFGTPVTLTVDVSAAVSVNDGFTPPNSGSNLSILSLAVQQDGKVIYGRDWGISENINDPAGNHLTRLNADGRLDASFNPYVNWSVYSIAIQANGKVVIGGSFTAIGGTARNSIARLNADGSLDHSFNPNANSRVNSIAVQEDGKIVIGGSFTTIGETARNYIARLNADGSLDHSFNPNANGIVYAIAVQADGKIVIGGPFTTIGGVTRNRIARLNADGSLDSSFDPNLDSTVSAIDQADGKIIIGGSFTTVGGTPSNRIARLNADGSLDTGFITPNTNSSIISLAVQADSKIVIVGDFTTVDGTSRNRIARLNSNGSLDAAFNPNANNRVSSIVAQPDGKIVISGWFTSVGSTARNNIARLNADGSLETTIFNQTTNNVVYSTAMQADGKIVIGGYFTTVGVTARNYIARLNADGTLDTSFNPDADNSITAIAVQKDGKVIIGGWFTKIGGVTRRFIARLNADGSLDTSFNPVPERIVYSIAIQADGKIVIGGGFSGLSGLIARLNEDGTLDSSFNASADNFVNSLAIQADGKIVIGGTFATVSGVARSRIARLNTDGSLDTPFNPAAPNNTILSVAVQADGKIVLGGMFSGIGAVTRYYIARLNTDGSLDTPFYPFVNTSVFSLALQADGKIVISGQFTTVDSSARNRIARLNADGSVDTSFDPNANGTVNSITIQGDGKVIIGGQFTTVGGYTRNNIARLTSSDDAIQALSTSADNTGVTWIRSGTVPEVESVTFERSSDMSTWTLLGSGTRISGGWRLTGLSLPVGQYYLRARGIARGGYSTGSSSFIESVKQIYNTNMSVTAFTAASPSPSKNIPITSFTATNSGGGITGYLITTSPAPPSTGASGWSGTVPATYTVTADGAYTLYPWAKDTYDNVSMPFGSPAAVIVETTPPSVTAFIAPAHSTSRDIPINSFTASDSSGAAITGYLITTSSTQPKADTAGWSGSAPATYTVTADGAYTLYPWAKDTVGNVSTPFSSPVTVGVDATLPSVTAFAATAPTLSWIIPITSFTASDSGGGISGYMITTSSTPPAVGAVGWSGSAPTTYTVTADGTYTLYPWAKDAVGNVSAESGSPVSITVSNPDTVAPSSSVSVPAYNALLNIATAGNTSYAINGTATDNRGISGIEVSTNGGSSWNSAVCTGCPGASVTWQYDWELPVDGSYTIRSRATDTTNIVETAAPGNTITLDRITPAGLANSTPADNSTDLPTNTTVNSSAATDSQSSPVQYWFQVATNSGFTTGVQQSSGWQAGTSFAPTLANNTNYYWHVKAKDTSGNETAYTPTWSFRTSMPPAAWTTKGDFENNASTVNSATTRSQVLVSGTNQADDAAVSLNLTRLKTISSTNNHAIAIKSDGSVWSWGLNDKYQLGTGGSGSPVATPTSVAGLTAGTSVIAVATGDSHTVFLKSTGYVGAVGADNYGQLGNGSTTTTSQMNFVPVTNLGAGSGVTAIAAGGNHSLALKSDGSVSAWGYNSTGQLGDSSNTQRTAPVQILAAGSGTTGVAAGASHSLAVKSDGSVWAWGDNTYGQLGDNSNTQRTAPVHVPGLSGVVAVAAGQYHSLAIKSDGSVWAWGDNTYGQLGDGSTTQRTAPTQVPGLSGVVAVAAGKKHSLALHSNGTVRAWGDNTNAKLGLDPATPNSLTPVQVLASGSGAVAVAGGASHSLALKSDGTIAAWGLNDVGQFGNGTSSLNRIVPAMVPDSELFPLTVDVAAGQNHSLAVGEDGSVRAWGSNGSGQLGDGTTSPKTIPFPISGLSGITDVAAGKTHSLAVGTGGSVWVWGDNTNGRLGFDPATTPNSLIPVQAPVISGATQVAAGGSHSLARTSSGSVWAWGYNNYGQLGDDSTVQKTTPFQVPGLADIYAVSAGEYHSLALKSDGTVWAWGYNQYGQLGDGSITQSKIPIQVPDLTGIIAVSAGYNHSMALKSDGSIYAWGYNGNGRVGNGAGGGNVLSPVVVLTNGYKIAAGYNHSLAVKTDRSLWAWGANTYGQLGDGTTTQRLTPVQVLNTNYELEAVAAGYNYSLVSEFSGIFIASWGYNNSGQLGYDTSNNNYPAPTQGMISGVRSPIYYPSPGVISNLKFNAGTTANWNTLSWNSTMPANTNILFRTRGAATEGDLSSATWSDVASSGSTINTAPSQWLELELTEQSTDNLSTPTVSDITVPYAP